jgi:hypothetical protein
MKEDEVIRELQRVAESLGKSSLARSEFKRHGRISAATVEKTFGDWSAATRAAGLVPNAKAIRLSDEILVDEFDRVKGLLGRTPSRSQFAARSTLSTAVYEKHFGTWSAAVAACTGTQPPLRVEEHPKSIHQRVPRNPQDTAGFSGTSRGRRRFGALLNFRGLQHEPLNEQGVVFLFGMVARDLGFLVESITPGYPDCTAKQAVWEGNRAHYEPVNIEFEFKSRNFNHDPSECDLVVCWEHNWPDCPIPVLELKSEIARLRNASD